MIVFGMRGYHTPVQRQTVVYMEKCHIQEHTGILCSMHSLYLVSNAILKIISRDTNCNNNFICYSITRSKEQTLIGQNFFQAYIIFVILVIILVILIYFYYSKPKAAPWDDINFRF